MDKKRMIVINLAVIVAVLLLALAAFAISEALPERVITPNAGTLEDAGVVFTMDGPAE